MFSFPKQFLILTFTLILTKHNWPSAAGSQHRLSPDSAVTYEEEYAMYQAEEDDGDKHLSRHKRFVYLNVDTNMAVALLVGIPLTFVLPSMSNLFSSWRRKRSIADSSLDIKFEEHNQSLKPEMEKVYTYFQLLNIPEPSCQLRAVCEFATDPEKYYPLSDLILKRIRNPNLPDLMYFDGNQNFTGSSSRDLLNNGQTTSLYELYNQAADNGQLYGYDKCVEQFADRCKYPIERLLNMPVIRFWSALQTLLRLSFKDIAMK